MALSRFMSSGRLSSSTSCSDSSSRISPASTRKSWRISSSAPKLIDVLLKSQAGKQVVDIILIGCDVFTLIGMNLRTFTTRRLFLFFLFGAEQLMVVLNAGKLIDLTGHQHQFQQVAFHFGNQLRYTLDHLAGQVLIILGQQDVIEVCRNLGTVALASREKKFHTLG